MNKKAIAIISAAFVIGFATSFSTEIYEEAENGLQNLQQTESKSHSHGSAQGFRLGTAHEHALFYVVSNDTEFSFLEPRYQLAESYVHLEANRSHIVHKHAKGVTWNDFLDTLNASVNRTEEGVCADIKNTSYCGEGAVSLNGQNISLDKEIMQGDKLVIVLQENPEQILENYDSKQLPRPYKPEETRGRRL
jgi:hypothetical protein